MRLGAEFYEDPAKALVGLRGSKERKRSLIRLKLVGILKKFLSCSLTSSFPAEGGMGTLTKYFNDIVPPCVELCVRLEQKDLLTDLVWTTFSQDPFSSAVYLECLEPYILSDQITRLPTAIVQQLLTHYQARDKLAGLEACITHLEVDCLDIHQAGLIFLYIAWTGLPSNFCWLVGKNGIGRKFSILWAKNMLRRGLCPVGEGFSGYFLDEGKNFD